MRPFSWLAGGLSVGAGLPSHREENVLLQRVPPRTPTAHHPKPNTPPLVRRSEVSKLQLPIGGPDPGPQEGVGSRAGPPSDTDPQHDDRCSPTGWDDLNPDKGPPVKTNSVVELMMMMTMVTVVMVWMMMMMMMTGVLMMTVVVVATSSGGADVPLGGGPGRLRRGRGQVDRGAAEAGGRGPEDPEPTVVLRGEVQYSASTQTPGPAQNRLRASSDPAQKNPFRTTSEQA